MKVTGAPAANEANVSTPPTSTPVTTTTEPALETNERGFLPMKLGEDACYGPPDANACAGGVYFAIDEIVVDPPCAEFGERLGHTLVLSLRVATGTDSESVENASVVFDPYSFLVIGQNGVSQQAEIGLCTDATDIPDTFGPNERYAFTLELDVPTAHARSRSSPGSSARAVRRLGVDVLTAVLVTRRAACRSG